MMCEPLWSSKGWVLDVKHAERQGYGQPKMFGGLVLIRCSSYFYCDGKHWIELVRHGRINKFWVHSFEFFENKM